MSASDLQSEKNFASVIETAMNSASVFETATNFESGFETASSSEFGSETHFGSAIHCVIVSGTAMLTVFETKKSFGSGSGLGFVIGSQKNPGCLTVTLSVSV
jgi:hypothetical protein